MTVDTKALREKWNDWFILNGGDPSTADKLEVLALIDELEAARAEIETWKKCADEREARGMENGARLGSVEARAVAFEEAKRCIRALPEADGYDRTDIVKRQFAIEMIDLIAKLEPGLVVVSRAAVSERLKSGHNDTCGSALGDYPCSCGHDALRQEVAVSWDDWSAESEAEGQEAADTFRAMALALNNIAVELAGPSSNPGSAHEIAKVRAIFERHNITEPRMRDAIAALGKEVGE